MARPIHHLDNLTQRPIRRSIIGERYGSLTVQTYLGHQGDTSYYVCQCDCGESKTTSRAMLSTKRCVKCAKCAEKRGAAHHAWAGCGQLPMDLWSRYEREAKVRGLPFELTIADGWALYEAQNGRCALSGVAIQMPPTNARKKEATASLDRIDSTKGYVEGNVQWVHKAVNHLKSNVSDDLFVLVCHLVAQTRPTTLTEQFFHDNHRPMVKNTVNAATGAAHHRSKTYRITGPDGEQQIVKGLKHFCREHGIGLDAMKLTTREAGRKTQDGWSAELMSTFSTSTNP